MSEQLYNVKISLYEIEIRNAWLSLIFGLSIFIYGLYRWNKKEQFENRLLYRQNLDKPEFSNECQSCGKIFDSITVYGVELNGDKNYHFCKNCYSNGVFLEPNLTLDEYKNQVVSELKTQNLKEKEIKEILKTIEGLDRWKRNRFV